MITEFGLYTRALRKASGEKLKDMAAKLNITIAFLSMLEVGRKTIPNNYLDLIANLYILDKKEKNKLADAIALSNRRVVLELDLMNEAQKDISLMFARKIKTADSNLLLQLREALKDEEN